MRKRLAILPLVGLLAACSGPAKPHTPATRWTPSAELTARLAFLDTQLESARIDNHIPGMAVAVVMGGRMVYARGFGVADMETGAKVTPETIFAIGSTTKAFTSTLLAMMVDEHRLDWDDPLSKHIPNLTLHIESDDPTDVATVRDALSHRTGFSRMGVLFAAATLDRDEIFSYASKAEPFAPYREKFLYNNITYLAAGVAGANAAGSTWETLIQTRILDPLSMTDTTLSMAAAIDDPRRATGYSYYRDLATHKREEMRNIDVIGPAGSINSNVIDMAKWLRLQLGGGEVDGKRLVSARQLAETRKKHNTVGAGVDYGLGWMLRDWRGHRLVEHGGNIDGYAASVAMLPELDMGYVLLTNVSVTVLQQTGMEIVFDALVGDSYKGEPPAAEDRLEDYAGAYLASFAPLVDQEITVVVKNDKLAIDVPGQMVLDLKPPDEDGRRALVLASEVAVSFERDAAGNVVLMRLHQGGFDMELPREGSEFAVEVSEADGAPFVGEFANADGTRELTVSVYRGRLAIGLPEMGVFQLDPADETGKRTVRANRDFSVRFAVDENGVATSVDVDFKTVETLVRVAKNAEQTDATLATLAALRAPEARAKAIARLGLTRIRGTVRFAQAGVDGTFTIHFSGNDKHRQELDFGKVGWMMSVVSGGSAWSASAFDSPEQLEGNMLAQAIAQHPAALVGDWSAFFDTINYVRADTLDDIEVHIVTVTSGALPKATLYVDAKTGDVLKVESVELAAFTAEASTTRLSDYREVGGVRFPFSMVVASEGSGTMVFTIEHIGSITEQVGELFPATLPANPRPTATDQK